MDVAWLTSAEGRAAISALTGVDPLTARSRLPHLTPERISAALTQARHRPAGFPLPLVTEVGIQQASPETVAQRRARRLVEAGVRTVIDAGCGIGIDSWAFAKAGLQVIAFEVDPDTAQVAGANLSGLDVEVRCADVTTAALPPDAALFVDPARRREERDQQGRPLRVYNAQQWRPPWSWVLDQARHRTVLARIRPGFRDIPEGTEWHCSSIRRRLVDATVWFPPLADVDRRASVHDGEGWHELVGPAQPSQEGAIGSYLIDPDPAIVRSGLVSNAALLIGGRQVDHRLAFITCDRTPPSWLGRSMRVLEEVDLKSVPDSCRRHGLATATLWARGFPQPPRLGVPAGQDAIVVAARIGPRRRSVCWIGVPAR